MPKTPKEILRLFKAAGWIEVRQRGSHLVLKKGDRIEVIPMHNGDLPRGLERKLLKRLSEKD